jgi:hypothetical protein
MVEKAMYGITALRYAGPQMVEAMMGLIDNVHERWEFRPSPTRIVEVIDRMVEGDSVFSMFPDADGRLTPGPEVKVDLLTEGVEILVLDDEEEEAGLSLNDLPRF